MQIILITCLGSILSLAGSFVLIFKKSFSKTAVLLLTSFAAGVLLTTAFMDLFPEALEHSLETGGDIFAAAFLGIILFFVLERTLFWFHHHHDTHGHNPTIWTITLGDGLHNFIDGAVIAASYMINPSLGITTALAVAAHEIPQEIADFSILLTSGLKKVHAVLFNVGSALTALIGAVGMYIFSDALESQLAVITAFTAGMFSYIALSDLIPALHHAKNKSETIPQLVAFGIGITLVLFIKSLIGDAGHTI